MSIMVLETETLSEFPNTVSQSKNTGTTISVMKMFNLRYKAKESVAQLKRHFNRNNSAFGNVSYNENYKLISQS